MSKQSKKAAKAQDEEIPDSPVAVEETAGEALEVRGYEAYIGRFWRGNTFLHSLGRTVNGKVTAEALEAFVNAVPPTVDLDDWISETDVHAEQNKREKVPTNAN